ncbi:MAG: hypothetical protein IJI01_01025 [Butyrivibrio sp.]|uniref:Uncharacterized protein n=1 Tax=Butyrivibrio proteoclasticus (strain ATCC 51982 / DSM 14932 / B316) TaxID=515622 RepID=E0RZC3_BUTPB|nr:MULTISPECIES: hypothetical protein [Butyrivibrio]ADL33120.1 hypothetical protein bpr_I0372 [Butyrivibrio proteoclasticus B316]MBQ6587242.1 hypothetical protein [Butyrivibrio sp.]
MRADVRREIPYSIEDLYELIYGDQEDEEYSCFIDRRDVNGRTVTRSRARHNELGELVKV